MERASSPRLDLAFEHRVSPCRRRPRGHDGGRSLRPSACEGRLCCWRPCSIRSRSTSIEVHTCARPGLHTALVDHLPVTAALPHPSPSPPERRALCAAGRWGRRVRGRRGPTGSAAVAPQRRTPRGGGQDVLAHDPPRRRCRHLREVAPCSRQPRHRLTAPSRCRGRPSVPLAPLRRFRSGQPAVGQRGPRSSADRRGAMPPAGSAGTVCPSARGSPAGRRLTRWYLGVALVSGHL